ncbi:MAG: hypothetical protein K2Q09_06770 [Phycisphaerales bacterium]|nr:hypothetical protein [Phycisphaerales bacterium]
MLILNPQSVSLGSAQLTGITAVVIDRATVAPLEQWAATGPWCALADSTKRRITVTLKQELPAPLNAGPQLGTQAELRLTVAPTRADASRRRIRCTCVVTAVEHALPSAPGKPAARTVTLLAVATGAPAGANDPVVIEEVSP